jgi:hypothetical protein
MVTVAGRSALVRIAHSTQQITAHAGLVLVRELTDALGLPELLDALTLKSVGAATARPRPSSPCARR